MFTTPRGTQDILPADWPYWDYVLSRAAEVARLFGYRRIETPTFEATTLFARTAGEGTDVVDKEMYTFEDRSGDDLTLRPEDTAPIMRAYLQHGMSRLPQPVKLWYVEANFRYDRPQRGRLREHHQFGAEAIGVEDAFVDVELIALLRMFYDRLGLRELTLHLNSIGDRNCRPAYVAALVRYLRAHAEQLSSTDRERVARNPLRVLDSKEIASEVLAGAPVLTDFLCDACRAHFAKLQRGLRALGIDYVLAPYLVRGLDYYTRTVFEFVPRSEAAQATVGAGGRYDALSEALGGPEIPGVGFGSGVERLILNVQEQGIQVPEITPPAAFVAHVGETSEEAALRIAMGLRQAGIEADMAFGRRSLKAQMRHAGNSGARAAVIAGEDELQRGEVTLRHLATGEQQTVPVDDIVDQVRRQEPSAG